MKRFIMSVVSLLIFACSCIADSGFVFEGKIGKYPVVMTIWATAVHASGDYYYVSQGPKKTLQLDGELDMEKDNPIWFFTERVNGKLNGFFSVYWDRFTPNGQRTIFGIYRTIKGTEYTVDLKLKRFIENPNHI